MELNADDVISEVGEFGLYQKLCFWLILIPVCALSGIQFQKQIIMTSTPDHWCSPAPNLQFPVPADATSAPQSEKRSIDATKRLTLPLETTADGVTRYSRCSAYILDPSSQVIVLGIYDVTNRTNMASADTLYLHQTASERADVIRGRVHNRQRELTRAPSAFAIGKRQSGAAIEKCKHGWMYDQTHFTSTVVTQWNLVCDRSVQTSISMSLFLLGGVVGVILSGYMADRWGRKVALLYCLGISSIADFISYFCTSFNAWLLFRSVSGIAVPSTYQLSFIIAIEIVGVGYRNFVTVIVYFFFSMGLVLVCGIMYLLRDWATLTLATSIPSLLILVAVKFSPESPRWLITQGKFEDTIKTLDAMCKCNGTELSDHVIDLLKEKDALRRSMLVDSSRNSSDEHSFLSLFRTPNMRKKTILVIVVWFINMTVYSGLSIFAPSLGTSPYMSLFLSSVIELPSHGILLWIMEWWSRRFSMTVLMVVGGLSCMATVLLPADDTTAHLILFLVGKFALSATFLILYAFGGELYPTEVRGKGLALSSYTGMLGSCISPFINHLGINHLTLPLIIMGFASVIGGFLCLLLPETLHEKLPETLEEGEKFGKVFQWKTFWICLPKIDVASPANEQCPRGRRPSLVPTLLFPVLNVTTLVSDPIFSNPRYTSSPNIRDIMIEATLRARKLP